MLRAVASAAGLIAAFVALLYLAYSGDTVPSPSPAPDDASVTPFRAVFEPVETPNRAAQVPAALLTENDVRTLSVGKSVNLPQNTVLMVALGCSQCDGREQAIARAHIDSSGAPRLDWLFPPEGLNLGVPGPTIQGVAVAPDVSEIFVSFCCRLNQSLQANRAVVFASTDGGVTWQERGETEENATPLGVVSKGRVLMSGGTPPSYWVFPDGESLTPPPSASGVRIVPSTLADGTVVWPDRDGHLRQTDGSDVLEVPFGRGPFGMGFQAQQLFVPNELAMEWRSNTPGTSGLLTIFDNEGNARMTFTSQYALLGGVWLSHSALAVTVETAVVGAPPDPLQFLPPYLLDLEAGEIQPFLHPFLSFGAEGSKYRVVGAMIGSFVRVYNTDGTCLNVRDQPSPDGTVLECAAEGVLLRAGDQFSGLEGAWRSVTTPSGAQGWTDVRYLGP